MATALELILKIAGDSSGAQKASAETVAAVKATGAVRERFTTKARRRQGKPL